MKIEVIVKPGSKKDQVQRLGDSTFKVWVKQKAIEGRANEAVRKLLADYFKVPRSRVMLSVGMKRQAKIFDIVL